VSKTKPRFLADDEAVIVVSGVRAMCEEVSLASCFGQPMMRNSVFDEFRASRFAAIQFETAAKVDLSDFSAAEKRLGLKEMYSCVSSA